MPMYRCQTPRSMEPGWGKCSGAMVYAQEHFSLAVFKEYSAYGRLVDAAVLLYCPLYAYFFADKDDQVVFLVKGDDSNFC